MQEKAHAPRHVQIQVTSANTCGGITTLTRAHSREYTCQAQAKQARDKHKQYHATIVNQLHDSPPHQG